jgi:hypothetical protein
VLIAIGIVGVVSALTIPTLIKNYQKRQTIVQLKKVYTLLNQAVRAANDEYGDMSGWDFGSGFMDRYLAPYMKLSKVNKYHTFKDLRGEVHYWTFTHAMPDGTLLTLVGFINTHVMIDLNGTSGPNVVGHDIFLITFIPESNAIWPYDIRQTRNRTTPNRCGANNVKGVYGGSCGDCNPGGIGGPVGPGSQCSCVIIHNWTFPKNYPW